MTAPSVFSIPPGESFVDALARGLLADHAADPLRLSATLVLLPTRRAARALREAFLRQTGGAPLLLPAMRAFGDADADDLDLADGLDLAPAVPPLRRQLLLARAILALGGGRGGHAPSPEQAVALAAELARLLDQVHTEGLDFSGLTRLVRDDFAEHWQITLDFLRILTDHWPAILTEQGWMDSALRRNRLIEAQAGRWQRTPPAGPVVAAGSTGSIPATARLLTVVAGLPQGRLVLPGLDRDLEPDALDRLGESHPQYGLVQLLGKLGLSPAQVPLWPGCRPGTRAWLVAEAMRPAETTDRWRRLAGRAEAAAAALAGVERLDCPGPREEAGAIALMMRGVLEDEARTAALVTPDRDLARRVAAELKRFDIEIDDSAGRPLDLTPVGAFLLLSARMVAEDFAPHALLSALKHPLALGGLAPGRFRARVRRLERAALRGVRPAPGLAGLRAAVAGEEDLSRWLEGLEHTTRALTALMAGEAALADLLRAHVDLVEALAAGAEGDGAARLWRGPAGEAASAFLRDLADAAAALPPLRGRDYPGLLRGLMGTVPVRPPWGGHPRLFLWGPLEARLQQADLLILGGLNEGTWPGKADADPWMSRPMRQQFGLPLPERRIGLAAHDFAQAFCAPRVVLTRSARVEGAPTVPSRWLLRLDAVLEACGGLAWPTGPWAAWHGALDQPAGMTRPRPPAPRPPLAARPRELFATAVETLMRDPYGAYARHILRLRALDPIDADPGAAQYGTVIHDILDRYIRRYPRGPLPEGALEDLLALGRETFAPLLDSRPGLAAFWEPKFERVAAWFIDRETARRPSLAEAHCEIEGRLEIAAPAGPFLLRARADRIDLLQDGSLAVLDYKTGSPPTPKEVAAGYAPQLPIEALIARHGGFEGLPARPVSQLLFWRLSGGRDGGREQSAGAEPERLAAEALEGLSALIAAFDDPATPYEARPNPDYAPKYSDYLHLARVREWASAGEEGEE
ncbi:PD-(D/E)XK nuclease superfamily protein [mine drainage metagenome]|uniref:PD-(D/E)XK nuclease superfamily protein n=1 Tax=mine drainage metagenome TaxID=410659 RepID=A0A1J5SJA8_9ZZZZ